MRQYGAHVDTTVDATGETVGLLFLEDVLEILVGEIDGAMSA